MNCLFYVKKKLGGKIISVFDVRYNYGVEFLVYDKELGWHYASAVYFYPLSEKAYFEEVKEMGCGE